VIDTLERKPIYSWKRLLFSLTVGIFVPVLLVLTAAFMRAFRAPGNWLEFLLWFFAWPYLSSTYPYTCRFLPSPINSWVVFGVTTLLNISIVFVITYMVTTFFRRRSKPIATPPIPPSFTAEDGNY